MNAEQICAVIGPKPCANEGGGAVPVNPLIVGGNILEELKDFLSKSSLMPSKQAVVDGIRMAFAKWVVPRDLPAVDGAMEVWAEKALEALVIRYAEKAYDSLSA